MILVRLFHWMTRKPVLPQGHRVGCRAGRPASPGEPFLEMRFGSDTIRIVPPESCRCDYHALRPVTFLEAVTGLSST